MRRFLYFFLCLVFVTATSCVQEVTPAISLDLEQLELFVGEEQQIRAQVETNSKERLSVIWSSSDSSVASVDAGKIVANGVGTAVITVSVGDLKASCTVTVHAVAVTEVKLDNMSLVLTEGDSYGLTATVLPANATDKSVTWSSSNTSIATVSSYGVVTAKAAGNATITVRTNDGGKTATCSLTVAAKTIAVTSVSLNKTTLSLTEGDTETLTATVSPSNATDRIVTWSSSNTSIATVSSDGVVTAKSAGNATITVRTNDGGKTATCSLTVAAKTIAITGVSLNKTTLSLTEGDTETLTATVSPSNATDKTVTWSSSNTSVATVSSDGVVTAKSVGNATITVRTNDGGKTATCSLTVAAKTIAVTSVSLNRTTLSLMEGDTETLTATVYPTNATNKAVTWSSNNTSVATVSSAGVVTAKSAGNATITVRTNDGGKTATCLVTVKALTIPVTGVSLDQDNLLMYVGDTKTLVATVYPSNATDKSLTWSSNNTTVATVSSSGLVQAKSAGSATITVKTNNGAKTQTCLVVVLSKTPVTSITLSDSGLIMSEGDTQSITATIEPSNATDKSVTWSSSDYSIVSVSSSSTDSRIGIITALRIGYAIVTAKTNDGEKTATCLVSVNPKTIAVTTVSLNKTSLSLTEGDTETLTATVYPTDATDKSVTWSSSNTAVATVSSSGVVTAKSAGNATIAVTTTDGGKTATCTVEVKAKVIPVTSVILDKSTLSLTEGETATLTATIFPSNATDKTVTWSSNNTIVAMVSSTGIVTARSAGNAMITVTTSDGGKIATCTVTVKAKIIPVTGVSLDKTSLSMSIGETQTLTATVTPSNATDKSVTWTTSNSSIATVSTTGVVMAKTAGSAIISVRTNDGSGTASCTVKVVDYSNYEYIDLGLPSGLKWASCNLGASSPEEGGDHYAWGETETKQYYWWGTYKWCNGSENTLTKYNTSGSWGTIDNRTTLSSEDDVAHVKLGGKWRMPTNVDWYELINSCTWSWSNPNGVQVSGPNGNSIFLPYAGLKRYGESGYVGGYYWSSSLNTSSPNKAWCVSLYLNISRGVTIRCDGFSIRPVYDDPSVSVTDESLNKTSLTLTEGDTETLTATVYPTNATNKNVSWSSNDTSVATVSSYGQVQAKSRGNATITVTTEDGQIMPKTPEDLHIDKGFIGLHLWMRVDPIKHIA